MPDRRLVSLTPFIGRESDLEALAAAIEDTRWVAVVGPPGVGKSRLVDEMVRRLQARDLAPPGGVLVVDLSSARTPASASATIAAILELDDPESSSVQGVARALAARGPALLVLHGVDALDGDLAALVEPLLVYAPGLRVVTTGRTRTACSGEVCFDVEPLSLADAVALFAARASAVRRGFVLDEERDAVHALVEAVDRLPLAIELAAARMRVLTPSQLAAHPQLVFAANGHQRLRAALDTAWEGLDAIQRAVLTQLAVFRGGFDLEDARAVVVVENGPPIIDVLDALCDASLVVARPGEHSMRFDVLAIVREYVAPPDADLIVRHAAHMLSRAWGWVGQLDGAKARSARAQLLAARANLLAIVERGAVSEDTELQAYALAAANAAASLQIRSGAYGAVCELIAAPLARVAPSSFPELCADAWWLRGEALRQAGHLDEARDCYARVRELAELAGSSALRARAGYGAAAVEFSRGELARAVECYRSGVIALAPAIEPVIATRALSDLGVITTALGEFADASAAFARALREARAGGCVTGEGRALLGLGQLQQRQDRLDDARGSFERALAIHEQVGDQRGIAVAHLQLGLNHHLRNELDAATGRYRAASTIAEQIGHRLLAAIVVSSLGSCAHAAGRLDDARRDLDAGERAFEELGHASYRVLVKARRGALAADRGELSAAQALLDEVDVEAPSSMEREVADAIAVCRAHVDFAVHGVTARGRAAIELARTQGVDARLQALVLARRLAGAPSVPARPVVVGPHARWITIEDERIGLERRGPMRRILATLVEARLAAPGEVVPTDELFEYGWPGQRVSTESAAQRVYTAIWTLRKLGLRHLIVRAAEGYFLDPAIALVQADAE